MKYTIWTEAKINRTWEVEAESLGEAVDLFYEGHATEVEDEDNFDFAGVVRGVEDESGEDITTAWYKAVDEAI